MLAALLPTCVSGQQRKVQNKPYIDERKFHYGFTIGMHDQGIRLQNNGYIDPTTGQQWLAECDRPNWGLSVGVLGEWKISKYMGLRLIPSLHFGSKHIAFREVGTNKRETQDMRSAYISVPLDLKISAPRFNNYRPYVVTGIAPMYDFTGKNGQKLATKPMDAFFEIGLGCDLYPPFFKLIPELKFCIGLSDILQKNRSDLTDHSQLIYTQSIDKATANMIVLSFYFE